MTQVALREHLAHLWWWATFLSLTCVIFSFQLGSVGAAIFIALWLLCGCLTVPRSIEDLGSAAIPWMFPAFAIASCFWSQAPAETFRAAVQLTATVAAGVLAGARLRPRQFVSAALLAELLAALSGFVIGRYEPVALTGEYAFVGIHPSKNWQGLHTGILMITAVAALTDKGQPRWLRAVGGAAILPGAFLLIQARSIGAAVGVAAAVGWLLALRYSGRLTYSLRVYAALLGLILVFAGGGLVLASGLFDQILNAFGKDSGLTGRTTLWRYAFYQIDQNPWFGVGYYAFWRRGLTGAETLWSLLHVEGRMGFTFHNLYLHFTVDLGLLGAAILAFVVGATFLSALAAAIKRISSPNAFCAAFAFYIVLRSPLEVDLGFPFTPTSFLFSAIYMLTLRERFAFARERRRPGRGRPSPAVPPATTIAAGNPL